MNGTIRHVPFITCAPDPRFFGGPENLCAPQRFWRYEEVGVGGWTAPFAFRVTHRGWDVMALKGPKPVYTGRDKPDAQLAKIFLLKNGIHAIVKGERSEMVRSLLGHALGLLRRMRSPVLGGPFGLDLEVLVEREDAGQAAALIAEYEKRNRSATDEEESYDPADFIRVVCDGCKRPAFFHVSKRGRVEQCPHCADYVDVR